MGVEVVIFVIDFYESLKKKKCCSREQVMKQGTMYRKEAFSPLVYELRCHFSDQGCFGTWEPVTIMA